MKIDATKAWQEYSPAKLSDSAVRHFCRRAGFATNSEQVAELMKLSAGELAEQVISDKSDVSFEGELDEVGRLILTGREPRRLAAWWLYRMTHNPNQAHEKAVLFWHGHFAASAEKVNNAAAMLRYYELLKQHSLGNFEQLVMGISRDAAMLIYLDSTENRKTHPNENYARELMELFCLGLGNYTEKDIQEVARCFTGWEVKRAKFRFNSYQHDQGMKSFFGRSGNFGGENAVRAIVEHPAAARFIATKLVRFYIADEPEISAELIDPLAKIIADNKFDSGRTIRTILSSNVFYSRLALLRKVRSPVEIAIGLLRTTGCSVNFFNLADTLQLAGQLPFYPPNVKGWDGGRRWINSSTLIARGNLVRDIVHGGETKWADGDAAKWLKRKAGNIDKSQQVDWVCEQLLAGKLSDVRRKGLQGLANDLDLKRADHVADLICAVAALPEFHLN